MTNYEHIKELDIEQLGHFLCNSMDELVEGYCCEHCPVRDHCHADELQGNGWLNWLKEVKK